MRLRLAVVATVLLLCAPAALHAASLSWNRLDASIAFAFSPSLNSQSRILVIGDKLVEDGTKQNLGWVSQLKGAYGDSVELYSLGSNLANTEAADSALASLLATPQGSAAFSKVMLVVLAFGSNELHAAHSDIQQPWVSSKAFGQHLGSMVRQLQARGDLKLLLVQPPPLQSMQEAAPYAEAVAAVAKQYDVPYVDTLAAIAKTPAWKTEAFKNGDQMSQLGHDILFGRIGTEIKRQLPTVSPQAMVQRAAAAVSTAAVPSSADDAAPTAAAAAAVGGRRHRRGGRAQPAAAVVHSVRRPRGPAISTVSTAAAGQPLAVPEPQADPTTATTAAVVAPALTLDQIVRGRFPSQGNSPQDVKPVEYHDPDAGLPRVNDLLHRARAHSESDEPATISSSSSSSDVSGRPASRWGNLDFVSKAINDELDNVPLDPPAAKPVTGTTSSSTDSTLAAEPMQQKATTAAAGSWQENVPEPSEEVPVWFTKVPEPAAKDAKLMVIPEPHLVNLLPKAAAAVAAIQSADPSAEAAVPSEAAPVPAASAAAPTWASQVPEPTNSAPTWMAAVPEPNKAAASAAAASAADVGEQKQAEQPAAAAAAPAAWYTNVPEPADAAPAWQASVAEPSPAKYAAIMQAREQATAQQPAASKRVEPEGEPQALVPVSASAADTWGKHVPEPVATVPTWFSAVPEPQKKDSLDSTEKPAVAAAPVAAPEVAVGVPKQTAEELPKSAAADKPAAEQPAVTEAPKAAADKPAEQKPATAAEQPAAKDVNTPKPAAAADKPVAQDAPKSAEQKPVAAEQPAAQEAPKSAAEKPVEADAPKPADKPAVEAQQPAQQQPAVADKPAAEVPKAAADKPAEQKPATAAEQPAAKDVYTPTPAAAADKSVAQDAPKSAEQKPVAAEQPAAQEAPKSAAEKPAEADAPKPADKPAVEAQQPAQQQPAVADKPAAEVPKAAADKPAEQKPATAAEQPAAKDVNTPKPAAAADKPVAQDAFKSAEQKPVAAEQPAAQEAPKSAAEKPAEADAPKPADKPAVEAQQPAQQQPAVADKPAAEVPKAAEHKPAAAAEPSKPAADAAEPAEQQPAAADKPAAELPSAAEQRPTAADKPAVDDAPKAAEQKPTAAAVEVPQAAAEKPAQQVPAEKPTEATSAPRGDAGKPVDAEQQPASKETPKAAGDTAEQPVEQKPVQQKPADKPAATDAPKPAADKSDKPAEQQQVEQKPVAVLAPPKAAEQKPADKPADKPAPVDAAKPTEQEPAAAADKVQADKPAADKPAAAVDTPMSAGEQKPADKTAGKSESTDSANKPQDQAAEKVHEVNLPPALKKWQTKVDFERPAVKAPEQKLSYRPVARKIAPNAPIAKPKNRAASYLQKLKPKWWSTAFEEDKNADQEVQAVQDSAQTFTHTPGAIDKLNPNSQAMMYPVNAQPTDSKAVDSLAGRTPNLPSAEPTAVSTGPAAEADLEAKPTLLAPATTTPTMAKDVPLAPSGTFGGSSGAVRTVPKTLASPAQQLSSAQQPAKGTFSSGPQIPIQQQPTAQAPKLTNKPGPAANTAPVADVPVAADGAEPVIPGALKQSPAAPQDAATTDVPSTPTFGATAPAADAVKGAAGTTDAQGATADKAQEPALTPQDTFAPTTQMPASPALAPAPAADKPQGADATDKPAAAPGTFGAQSGNTFAPVPAAAEPKHVGQAAGKKDASGTVKPKGGQHPDDADVLLQNGDVQGEVQKSQDTPKDSDSKDTKEEEYEQNPKKHHKDHKAEDKYGHDDPDLHNTLENPPKKAPKHKEPHKEKDSHKEKPNKNKPQKKHHPKHPAKGHKHGPEQVPYTEEHVPEPYGHTPDTPYRPDGPGYPHDHPHDDGYHPEHPSFYREEHEAPYHKQHDEEPYPAHFNIDDRAMPLADPSRAVPPEEELKGKDIDRAVSAEEDPSKPLIVTLGDFVMRQGSFGTGIVASSADSGWISRLAAAYGAKAQVVNRGQATATSPEGVEMVRALLTDYPNAGERIKLVVLSFGGNDAITRSGDKATKVALADYKENIMTMVAELRKAGVTNIMLVTPPPAARRSDRRFKTVKDYAKASTDAAKAMNVPTVDLFSAVSSLKDWQASAMNEDGLRLSERGQQLLFKRVMKVLNSKQLQHVSPAKLQPQAVSQ